MVGMRDAARTAAVGIVDRIDRERGAMGEERCPASASRAISASQRSSESSGNRFAPGLLPGLDRLGGVARVQPRRLVEEAGARGADLQAGIDRRSCRTP